MGAQLQLLSAQIQQATLAARTRTGDKSIAVAVKQGRARIVRVTYPAEKRGASVVNPVTEFMPVAEVVRALEAI